MTFQAYLDSLVAVNQRQIRRGLSCCDWRATDGRKVFHERYNVPWSPFKPTRTSYWSEAVYTDKAEAEADAKTYSGAVEMEFYCNEENPAWFLIFENFDNAARHAAKFLDIKLESA